MNGLPRAERSEASLLARRLRRERRRQRRQAQGFKYSGPAQEWKVPAGVTSVRVYVGGGGWGGTGSTGYIRGSAVVTSRRPNPVMRRLRFFWWSFKRGVVGR